MGIHFGFTIHSSNNLCGSSHHNLDEFARNYMIFAPSAAPSAILLIFLAHFISILAVLAYVIKQDGVKLGTLDSNGRTAMHLAARNTHAQAVFMLLDAGGVSLAEKQDSEGTTAVHFAAIAGEENIIRVLVQVRCCHITPHSRRLVFSYVADQFLNVEKMSNVKQL